EEAELKLAQSYYLGERYAEAIAAYGDFERMHPTSANLAEVEYHLGMSYLRQSSTSDRDRQSYTNALTYFRNIVDRFPQSPWAAKASLRVRECREALAAHETQVATYYLRHGNLRAAEARLSGLLADYPDTDATAQALHAFAKAYEDRKEPEGATLALATLARYHPDGPLGVAARARGGRGPPPRGGAPPLPVRGGRMGEGRPRAAPNGFPPRSPPYPERGAPGTPRY